MAGVTGVITALVRVLALNVASITQQPSVHPNFGHQKLFPSFLLRKDVGAK